MIIMLVLTVVIWFWAIYDVTKSRFKNPAMRFVCFIGVLIFPVVGSIFYFQLKKSLVEKRSRQFGMRVH